MALTLMGLETLEAEAVLTTLNVLFKYREDLDKARNIVLKEQEV